MTLDPTSTTVFILYGSGMGLLFLCLICAWVRDYREHGCSTCVSRWMGSNCCGDPVIRLNLEDAKSRSPNYQTLGSGGTHEPSTPDSTTDLPDMV
jgi:hypothetical protein